MRDLLEFERNTWVTVAEITPFPGVVRLAYLCEPNLVSSAMSESGVTFGIGDGVPGFSQIGTSSTYSRVGDDPAAIPLVFVRDYRSAVLR